MKPWEKIAKGIAEKAEQVTLTSQQIMSYLGKKGYKATPIKLGRLMVKLGFTTRQINRQGRRIREYTKLLRPTVKMVGFKCYHPACPVEGGWNGFYKLQANERVDEKDRRTIVNDDGKWRIAVCPACHPPGKLIESEGVHYVHFYRFGYKKGDGVVHFLDEYLAERARRGLPTEAGYHGRGQLEASDDFNTPW